MAAASKKKIMAPAVMYTARLEWLESRPVQDLTQKPYECLDLK